MFRNIFFTIIALCVTLSGFAVDFTVQKLPNGQTLVVQEIKDNPIVTIDTWVKTGSINETDVNSGVAHFLEHLFFKGTKKHPVGDFEKKLEAKGAVVNAATSKDFTHYYITIPSEYFEQALELHSDMLLNPQIPRKELEQERKVVLEEIAKDGNNPTRKVFENLNSLMYKHHPYKRTVLGSADVISTIRREEILDFFNKYYVPSNMITLVVGDVDTEKVTRLIGEQFNSEYKKVCKNNYRKELPITSQRRNVEYFDGQAGYMMIGFRTVDINDGEMYALDVLAQVLGGGKASKLYSNIKEQKGIAYSIKASNASYKDDGVFYINSNFIPTNAEKLEKSIFDEITYIQKYGITEEELNTAKKIIEQKTYYQRESTTNIATELGYIMTLSGSSDIYTNYIDCIKNVTAQDVQRVAQKYLGKNKSAVSIILPKSMENIVDTPKKEHKATKVGEKNGLEKYVLDNNSTLILNKHNNNDIVAISIFALGGSLSEKIRGEGNLLASTLLKGTKKYSAQELAKLMEENGIKIVPTKREDYFEIVLKTTTSQLDLTFDILNEILNNATIDDYELEKSRSDILNTLKQQKDLPMNVALDNYRSLIFENSNYSVSNSILENNLPKITRDNVLNYYRKIFDSKNVLISVNGDITSERLINEFGSILDDKKQPKFKYSNYKIPSLTTKKEVSKDIQDLQTSWVFLGWQVSGVEDKKDFVVLKVIDTMLGGGMSSRLFKNLREQDGLAYQLGSTYRSNALAGNFMMFVGTNPETLAYAKDKMFKEIERLKLEFVSDTELNSMKDRLKGGFIIALETNSDKATNIGRFEALGLGYDYLDEYIKMVDEVSASDIVRVANKYFNNIYVESIVK